MAKKTWPKRDKITVLVLDGSGADYRREAVVRELAKSGPVIIVDDSPPSLPKGLLAFQQPAADPKPCRRRPPAPWRKRVKPWE